MNEIEVKILGVDIDKIKEKILLLGGKLLKQEIQENYCYDLPPHLSNQNGFIRIRKIKSLIDSSEKVILCSKKIISQSKARITDENEVEINSFEDCLKFVESLELKLYRRSNKQRESYTLNDALIEIDTLDKDEFPEPYIEIEAVNENLIYDVMDLLEIPRDKATSKSLRQIRLEMNL